MILLPAIAPVHQSAHWVFTTFAPDKTYSGIESNGLLFMLSLLGSQWAMGRSRQYYITYKLLLPGQRC